MYFKVDRLLAEAAAARPVLGLDTSMAIAGLAIVAGGKIAAAIDRPAASHGAALPGAVAELLRAAGMELRDFGAIAIGIGPGSFTGLRIGLGYAKGIAAACGCVLLGVPSFDATALAVQNIANARVGTLVCPVADARKGEAYCALYRSVEDGLQKVLEESIVTLESLASRIAGGVIFAGDAKAREAADRLGSEGQVEAVIDLAAIGARGGCIAAIGAARFARGEFDPAAALEPLYIRPVEATFKPAAKHPAGIIPEGIWSEERKNSFTGI